MNSKLYFEKCEFGDKQGAFFLYQEFLRDDIDDVSNGNKKNIELFINNYFDDKECLVYIFNTFLFNYFYE